MNFLAHFVFNHDVGRIEPEPYFVMDVALPDLWPRFSRRRRIRWAAVRAADTAAGADGKLRAGLLNHVDADRRFHTLPSFLSWQRELKAHAGDGEMHSALRDFLSHLAIELVLDQKIVVADDGVAERFYAALAGCDSAVVERRVGEIGQVDAAGLAGAVDAFLDRRYLFRYAEREGLLIAVQRVLALTTLRPAPKTHTIERVLDGAANLVDPARVWAEMTQSGASRRADQQR